MLGPLGVDKHGGALKRRSTRQTIMESTRAYHLRDFETQDIAPLTDILNAIYPDEPSTLEQNEYWERTYPADNPRLRRVAVADTGEVVGLAECQRPFWSNITDSYAVFVAVAPAWQGRGIGQALLAAVTPFAPAQGAVRVRGNSKEDDAHTTRFLLKAGFHQIGIRYESVLDIQAFDETPFLAAVESSQAAGYTIISLAEARRLDPEADRHLFNVFAATVVDVPFPGEERMQPNFENFRDGLEAPQSNPEATFIAWRDGRMAGLSSLELLANGIAITSMTGVLREDRGHGVAMALKLASFRFLKAHGYREARTHNDTANPPILALNDKLGYRRLPGWFVWEKLV